MNYIKEISECVSKMNENEINQFFKELLTESEITTLSKRWCILKMLFDNYTQRQIANELGVSLCKVTRGAKILKEENSIVKNAIQGEYYDNATKTTI